MQLIRGNLSRSFFFLPALLVMTTAFIAPLGYAVYYSFSGWILSRPGSRESMVGFSNYVRIVTDAEFWRAVAVTFQFAAGGVFLQCLIGLGLALVFNLNFMGRGLLRSMMLIPMVVTPAVISIFWKMLYDEQNGLYNFFLATAGIPRVAWLDMQWALASIILLDTWQSAPFFMLILLAGLQGVDQSSLEAAKVDGATPLQVTRYILLPHLVPYIVIAAAFRCIGALAEFDKMYLLTFGGPGTSTTSISLYAYNIGFRVFDMGRTTAAALIIMSMTLVFTSPLIVHLLRKRG